MPLPPPDRFRVALAPGDVPGLITFWDFQQPAGPRAACSGAPYILNEINGPIERVEAEGNPWGAHAARLREGQYLVCPRQRCPLLDVHGPGQGLTVIAWVQRHATTTPHCEFIAGQWNETHRGRQYGLFLNIVVWGLPHGVCAHVSNNGGPTPGYRYCIDAATGPTPVSLGQWHTVGMTYDGTHAAAWLDGRLDRHAEVNPYPLPGGLHDGGATGSDFTVGAVDRSGEMGNFFTGLLGGLAVYSRALTPAELRALHQPGFSA